MGGTTTFTVAVEVFPTPRRISLTVTLLVCVPAETPVTFTVMVHEPAAAKARPVRLTVLDPCVAVIVPLPHVVDNPVGVASTNPAGRVSVKLTLLSALGAVMVNVRLVVPPSWIMDAPNALAMEGGASGETVRLAVAVFPGPATGSVAVTELVIAPAAVPVTFTWTVHAPPAKIELAAADTVFPPATADKVPSVEPGVQALRRPFGVETAIPAGKVSVKVTPVRLTAPVLLTVMSRVVLPPIPMLPAPKNLTV